MLVLHEVGGEEDQACVAVRFGDQGYVERNSWKQESIERTNVEFMARITGCQRYRMNDRRNGPCILPVVAVAADIAAEHAEDELEAGLLWHRVVNFQQERVRSPATRVSATQPADESLGELIGERRPVEVAVYTITRLAKQVGQTGEPLQHPLPPHRGPERVDSGGAEGFQLPPFLESDFYAVTADRFERVVLKTAELKAPAPEIGTRLIKAAGRVAFRHRAFDAVLSPEQQRQPFQLCHRLERNRWTRRGVQIRIEIALIELEHRSLSGGALCYASDMPAN